jgi:putative ABC transport system ATP-binding protein
MELFQSLNSEGMTIVMVTHSPESAQCAGRIMLVSDGLLVREDEVMKQVGAASEKGTGPKAVAMI